MSNITKANGFSLTPSNLQEAMQYAEIMAKSTVVPKQYQSRPGDILVAVQMGADLGLKPMQALQNIAVINGRPCIWGDALLALVQAHPAFEDIKETIENGVATCTVKRKGQQPHTVTFSLEDAKKAGLLGKPGPWSQYTNRMLALRARGFALRDRFADALGGLITAEEAQDYPTETRDVTPETPKTKTASLSSRLSTPVEDEDITPPKTEKESLIEELQLLITNSRVDDGFNKMCEKLGVESPLGMTIEQLTKAVEWAKERQDD